MNPTQLEAITKAAQCADQLTSDLREAHKLACEGDYFLEILLLDLIADAVKLKPRMARIQSAAIFTIN